LGRSDETTIHIRESAQIIFRAHVAVPGLFDETAAPTILAQESGAFKTGNERAGKTPGFFAIMP